MTQQNRNRLIAVVALLVAGAGLTLVAFGNIGNSRLELAVIGDTVNVASRLESLTRELDATIAVSREVLEQAIAVAGPQDPCLAGFHPVGPRKVQGTSKWIEVAAISRPPLLPPAAA